MIVSKIARYIAMIHCAYLSNLVYVWNGSSTRLQGKNNEYHIVVKVENECVNK